MTKKAPDHHDADLVLKLYDLRREPVMRESRDGLLRDFWPKSEADAVAVLDPQHPLNRAFRQVSTYWEMAYGMARHGIVHVDYLLENSGEGMFLFARVEPYLAALREKGNPRAFTNAEWISKSGDLADSVMARFRKVVAQRT